MFSFYFICRHRICVEEFPKLLSKASDGQTLQTVSSAKKSQIKLNGNYTRKLDFPLDDQQPPISVTNTSQSIDNENNNNSNNNVSVHNSSKISDSELSPKDDSGSEYHIYSNLR